VGCILAQHCENGVEGKTFAIGALVVRIVEDVRDSEEASDSYSVRLKNCGKLLNKDELINADSAMVPLWEKVSPSQKNRGVARGATPLDFHSHVSRLPATVAAATAVATISATATAASTTTASTSPAPSTAATAVSPTTTPAAAGPAAASTATFAGGPGFVDHNVAAHEVMAVQTLDGAIGFFIAVDFDKPETARLAGKTVAHQGDGRCGDSGLRK
jgi:hypothetical protein